MEFKVPHVGNIKLGFYRLIFLYLLSIMQNPIQKFRQSSTVSEKPGILPEKLKALTSSNYHQV